MVSGRNRKIHWRFEPLKLLLSFDMDCAPKQWGADGVDMLAASHELGEAVLREKMEYDILDFGRQVQQRWGQLQVVNCD